jgi:hypothetical protein
MHERIWQFRLDDNTVVDCVAYFSKRAKEVADSMNCEILAANVARIERLRGNVRNIVGTAVLQNPQENVLEFPQGPNRRR